MFIFCFDLASHLGQVPDDDFPVLGASCKVPFLVLGMASPLQREHCVIVVLEVMQVLIRFAEVEQFDDVITRGRQEEMLVARVELD
jgi:hypothetical protein